MRHLVKALASGHERWFGIAWRVAIFVLPWQTRWLHDRELSGWPWEQGSAAVYASWFPMIAAVLLGWPFAKRHLDTRTRRKAMLCIAGLLLASALAVLFADQATRTVRALAGAQWWAQLLMLAAFGLTLWRAQVRANTLIDWFLLSLVPHSVLGWAQYVHQSSPSSRWLGLAYHAGKQLGASVVEHDDFRVLRVYGGFPHPNIFGGWLALAVPLAFDAAARAWDKGRVLAYASAAALFSAILVLTYSRGAWIAAFVGLVLVAVGLFRKRRSDELNRQGLAIAVFCVLVLAGTAIVTQRAHLLARVDAGSRLEVKSVTARESGLRDGLDLFKARPLAGSGPNAVLVDVATQAQTQTAREPLEPPHDAYLLAADEVGLIGIAALACLVLLVYRAAAWRMPLAVIGAAAVLDHYPWSTWSGQVLLMLCLLLACASYTRRSEGSSTA